MVVSAYLGGNELQSRRIVRIIKKGKLFVMSDLNRGIMKFKGADTPKAVTISTVLVLGSIALLIFWALQVAYEVN